MKSKIFISLVIIILLLFSCKDTPCDVNTSSLLQIGFYAYHKPSAKHDTLDTLSIYGIGKAGYYLYKDSAEALIYLPLSMNMDSSSFVINSKGKKKDTLTINYTRHLQLISKECGFSTIFNITNVSVTRHFFDSLKVTNSTINTSYGENIRIFF
ncbi:MAG: DUF6452 family protein [Bacteroidales bacterium]|jgi:hypothetical protein